MTFEEKQNIDKQIAELIGKLVENNPDGLTDAMMLIHSDAEYQNVSFVLKGDSRLLANGIQHHMTANEEFRRFMFATIGSFLSGNKPFETEFINGLQIIKNNLGMGEFNQN